jgi:hypothetical protein
MNNQDLYQVIKDGKSGFINREGTVIIDFEFDSVSAFSEGLARIFHKEKVGFIDTNGNIVIQPIFDNAMNFSEGLAVVSVGEKFGYINKQGEFVISPSYYSADDFKNGIALVRPDIISTGCFINKKGKVLLRDKDFLVSKYSEGLINCSLEDKWGFIDLKNQFVIPPIFNYAREFSEGKAAVVPIHIAKRKLNKKQLFGFIDKENEEIIPPLFEGSDIKFSDNLCAVWDNGYGCVDKLGELIIPYDFELIEHFKGLSGER